ncbi:hypothetical protein LJC61_03550 [Ruminococcaceae bacterium OttesenSCG-928-A16]|nr:hypothetical protein [Ruminococcaceae bacterium OttesenSCG-928-A16]
MDFAPVIDEIKQGKLAGRRFEKEGHGKFRDCVTVYRNNKLKFERYCYGEAASLVCVLWAAVPAANQPILWDTSASDYSGKTEAPQQLTGIEGGKLLLDGKATPWAPEKDYKTAPDAGLGRLAMLFNKN